jgi:hypothetical protein
MLGPKVGASGLLLAAAMVILPPVNAQVTIYSDLPAHQLRAAIMF